MTNEANAVGGTELLPEADDVSAEKRLAAVVVGAFFVVFLGWAAFVPLDSGATAPGVVTVSGSRQAVQHRDGGVVSALYVKEGDLVAKGQVVLVLAAGDIEAVERGLAAEIYALLAQKQRLIAESYGADHLTPPAEFAGLTGADRKLADEAWQGQLRQFAASRTAMSAQQGVLGRRSGQSLQRIDGLQNQIVSNREQRRLIGDELEGMKKLEAQGFAATNRVRALERNAAALDGENGALVAQIATTREAMGEVSMQSISLEKSKIEDATERLRDVNLQIDEGRPKLAAARAQLERAQVRAPASGRVVGLNAFTVGGVVAPGQMLMEIVPQDRELVVTAMVAPQNADDIHVGQQAQVRFTALEERNIPILMGKVTGLSADSFTNEKTGQQFFRAEVQVPASELALAQAKRPGRTVIQPGLPAEIFVPLRKRSALVYLVEPLGQAFWHAGREN